MNIVKEIEKAEAQLIKLDPKLGKFIELQRPIVHEPNDDYFFSLCRSIISQQISTAAAAAVFGRFQAATKMKPSVIAKLTDEELRAVGLSRQKAGYLRDLAGHFVDNPKVYNHLNQLTDDEVVNELVRVKGIGNWSAQMFLMFTLVRLDVFAPDDIGLQRAIKQLYGLSAVPKKDKLIELADNWRPYRTVASWHLWRSLSNDIDF